MSRSPSSFVRMRRALALELPPLARLAGPVVASEVGWMAMWVADTIIVGRLGAEAIGAVSIGGSIFFAVAIFGLGMMLGLDFVVASAFGAGRLRDAHAALVDGLWLAVALAVALTAVLHIMIPFLPSTGIQPAVLEDGIPYLYASSWSLLPLLLFTALRRYLQALGLVRPILVTILTANVVNVAACWVLVFGNLGAPALGPAGSGWATTASRIYLFACLALFVVLRERDEPTGLWETRIAPAWDRLRALVRLGVPAAMQITAEVGVFSVVTALAASFEPGILAAHQIALNSAAFTFMVPAGLASAAAVRVGQAVGRRDADAARRAGWAALVLGLAFMSMAAVAFVTVPGVILGLYTSDATVLASGVALLLIAGAFQLFDGMQVVMTGALRGLGDTRTPMIVNLVGFWLIGLPLGWVFCFRRGAGVPGLWMGLCVGLVIVALTLLVVWARRSRDPLDGRAGASAIAVSG